MPDPVLNVKTNSSLVIADLICYHAKVATQLRKRAKMRVWFYLWWHRTRIIMLKWEFSTT